MDAITFYKNYGRELEIILSKAHDREAKRLSEILIKGNHHLLLDAKYDIEEFATLKMLRDVCIRMNRDEKVDSQPNLNP